MTASNANCRLFRATPPAASVRWPTMAVKNFAGRGGGGTSPRRRHCRRAEESAMSKERPTDDPRNESDWKNTKQTDRPWEGLPEKDQRPNKTGKPDLERWKDSGTH